MPSLFSDAEAQPHNAESHHALSSPQHYLPRFIERYNIITFAELASSSGGR